MNSKELLRSHRCRLDVESYCGHANSKQFYFRSAVNEYGKKFKDVKLRVQPHVIIGSMTCVLL